MQCSTRECATVPADASARAGFGATTRGAGRSPTLRLLRPNVALPAASLALIAFMCFLWPVIWPVAVPIGGSIAESHWPLFSPGHFLGTDMNGNDVWSRLLHGGRASLQIAVAVNVLGLSIGGVLGGLSGYIRGVFDSIVMRTLDVLIAFPSLVLAIAVAQALKPSLVNTIWALAFFSIPAFARVARAGALRLSERPFIVAAELAGSTRFRIFTRHITPNILPQLVEFALLGMGVVITLEGALSFLGLGVQPPYPSWGNMIFQGQHALFTKPSLVLLPSAALFVTVLSFNLLGRAMHMRWSVL